MVKNGFISTCAVAAFVALGAIANAQGTATDTVGMPGPPTPMHGLPVGGDGPTYVKSPDLPTTAALAQAGGGAANFSIATALTAMVGPDITNKEVAKLTDQYGKKSVADWITVFNFVVQDGAATATSAGVTLPAPDPALQGKALASALVRDGIGDSTFWTGTMLDHLVSHAVHLSVMDHIDKKFGAAMDGNYHRITDQAMYDLAIALGASTVHLASFH